MLYKNQRLVLSEGETRKVQILKDEFYEEFSKLIASKLNKVPVQLHDFMLTVLNDTASVYGSNFEHYVSPKATRVVPTI